MNDIEGAGCDMDGNSGVCGLEAGVTQAYFGWPRCQELMEYM